MNDSIWKATRVPVDGWKDVEEPIVYCEHCPKVLNGQAAVFEYFSDPGEDWVTWTWSDQSSVAMTLLCPECCHWLEGGDV